MPALVNRPFAHTFDFSRSIAAPYRNASGAVINAPIDTPRFDHSASGNRIGLLIARGAARGQHDALEVVGGDWEALAVSGGKATVLFGWAVGDVFNARAIYTSRARATVNGCLMVSGHHRMIGVVPGHLPNLGSRPGYIGGYVRFRNRDWPLGLALDGGDGLLLGDQAGRVIIESS
jgi:hypothetical protein